MSPSSPREPVPTPPPLSLSDLFKNIHMPPPTPAASHSPPGSAGGADQRTKLLGMLSFGGTPASGATSPAFTAVSSPPVIAHQSGIITSPPPPAVSASPSVASLRGPKATLPGHSPAHSPAPAPAPAPVVEGQHQPQAQAEAQKGTPKAAIPPAKFTFISPFDAFEPAPSKGSAPSSLAAASPVGSYRASPVPASAADPTSGPAPSPAPAPAPASGRSASAVGSGLASTSGTDNVHGEAVTHASIPAQTIPTKQTPTPKAKNSGRKEQVEKVDVDAVDVKKEEGEKVGEVEDPAIAAFDPSPAPPPVPATGLTGLTGIKANDVKKQVVVPSPSALTQPKLTTPLPVPVPVQEVMKENSKPPHGPTETASHITVDLGKPNAEHVIPPTVIPGALNVQAITITKTSASASASAAASASASAAAGGEGEGEGRFGAGRKVGVTRQFMGYTMSKGRIRLIDSRSGARLMLQTTTPTPTPTSGSGSGNGNGSIIDLAVTPIFIAALASDRSLWIWRVPPGWAYDNPPVELVFVGHTAGAGAGQGGQGHWAEGAERVEWVKRHGGEQLVIGGQEGVVLFNPLHPSLPGQGPAPHPPSLFASPPSSPAFSPLLKADGPLVDFCINAQNVALGLMAETGHFTLYSLGSLNRVWARMLPGGSGVHERVSGCLFVESNVCVGRKGNTYWDLVQISTDIAVLSSIRFLPPPSAPASLAKGGGKGKHWTKAVYDPGSGLLFIAPYLRNSLYAFRYALKGSAPLRDVSLPNGPRVVGFDLLSEFPLAPAGAVGGGGGGGGGEETGVSSLAMIASLGNQPGREAGDLDFVVKTDKGAVSLHLTQLGLEIAQGGLGAVEKHKQKKKEEEEEEEEEGWAKVVEKPEPVQAWASRPAAPASIPAPKAKVIGEHKQQQQQQQSMLSHPLPSGTTLAPNHASEQEKASTPSAPGSVSGDGGKKGKKERKQKEREDKMVRDLEREEQETNGGKAGKKEKQYKVVEREREAGWLGTEGVGRDEVESMLIELEARLGKQFQQDLHTALFPITQKVEYLSSPAYLASLTSALSSSLQSTLLPALSQNIGKDILGASKASAREVVTLVGREVGRKVDESVDSVVRVVVQEAVVQDLLPVLRAETSRQTQAISADLHSELLQLRKSLSPPPLPPAPKGPTQEELQEQKERQKERKEARERWVRWEKEKEEEGKRWEGVRGELRELRKLVGALQSQQGQGSREVPASAPIVPAHAHPTAPSNPVPQHHPPFPHPGLHPNQFPQHPPFPPPPPAQLTDTFIAVLSKQSVPETVQLVMDHRPLTDYILPVNGAGKSPLGQAVLLTVVHRLSTAISDLPLSPNTPTLLEWLRRSLAHLQPGDAEIETWAGRVLPLVREGAVRFVERAGVEGGPAGRGLVNEGRELISQVESKMG
ncbi:hypothetical protein L198_06895 [Cryptococcus wingfieldii CBS 7118]|uniref:Uncharacterized protein n=1 Tax=Cryptococcus wingfieldii CBS 7118 TaxID=1295528 RepID=A0A1E3IGD3_9TREE|nr:hypothetical protein L198_06895 [Cryptococcus wingfieldii CBS 7118]ODN87672.1 hypothetical protein L198_06895 [Cryptococcus wingfieldii CBS 7118]